jgi:putative PIN family toxin of toxin-antitoxin system
MSRIQRVVFDTSTLVSAALRIGSIPHQALLKASASFDVCANAETLAELEKVLSRKKFDRYLDRESRTAFVALIRHNAHLFSTPHVLAVVEQPFSRDPDDNKFLALALAAEADVLVSSDQDLLVLHPWRGIPIVRPAEFLDSLRALP